MTVHKNIYKLGKSAFGNNNREWKSLDFWDKPVQDLWMLSGPFAAFI